jgi:hypothetical protein
MSNNNKNSSNVIPGMETFLEEEEEYFFEGVKNSSYFDAAGLPDSPHYQANASGATTYTMFIVFPSREELVRAITALTSKGRKGLAAGAKIGTLNGIARTKEGITLLEMWEREILGIQPKVDEIDPDEAQAPI